MNPLNRGGRKALKEWYEGSGKYILMDEDSFVDIAEFLNSKKNRRKGVAKVKYLKASGGKVITIVAIGMWMYRSSEVGVKAATLEEIRDYLLLDEIHWGMSKVDNWFSNKFRPLSPAYRCEKAGVSLD